MNRLARLVLVVLLLGLGGCSSSSGGDGGGGGNGNGNGNTLPDDEAELDGTLFGVSRAAAEGQSPLAGIDVVARRMPGSGAVLARAQTTARGSFLFSLATANTLPRGASILLRAENDTRRVLGVVNTTGAANSKSLNEVTHLAALAMLEAGESVFTAAELALFETAAREALEAALVDDPQADSTALANQAAAQQLAEQIAIDVAAGAVTPNAAPTVGNAILLPTQLPFTGGTVDISCEVTDTDGDAVEVFALVWLEATPTVVPLSLSGGQFTGSIDLPGNDGESARSVQVGIVADDGRSAATPAVLRTVAILPEGRITLDILVETLFDEPADRARLVTWPDGRRPRVRRGVATRSRQVNPDQTIRGAAVVVNDRPEINGVTGDDGLLLLSVPMSLLDDGLLTVTTSLDGRISYRQALLVPEGVALLDGDVIEVDLVLGKQADWSELAALLALQPPDFAKVPITGFFNVLNNIDVGPTVAGTTRFSPLDETDRQDDGDFFVVNLQPGEVTASGSFADPNSDTASPAFGPVGLEMTAGEVQAVSALIPPS